MVQGLLTVQSEDLGCAGANYTYDGVKVDIPQETKDRLERGDSFGLRLRPFYVGTELVKYGEV